MKRRDFLKGVAATSLIAVVPSIAKTEPELRPILNKDGSQWKQEFKVFSCREEIKVIANGKSNSLFKGESLIWDGMGVRIS